VTLAFTPVWFIGLPLLLAFLSPIWARWGLLQPVLIAGHLALVGIALALLGPIQTGPWLETLVVAPPLGIHLHLDMASWVWVTLFAVAGTLVATFLALSRPPEHLRGRSAFVLILLLIAGCNGVVLTGDLFNLYVFLEIAGLSAYGLAALRRDAQALEAGLKYLLIGAFAGIFFLFGTVLLYAQLGSLNMAALATGFPSLAPSMQWLIGVLVLIGLGIKAELLPFNFWVPDIYRGTDPAITALFSGVVVKAFVFVLFHLAILFVAEPELLRAWLMAIGGATFVAAEWVALKQSDLRRALAYSSLGQIGLIALALGFGDAMVTAGAFFHVINHTLVKLLLFSVVALMAWQTAGRLNRAALQGLSQRLPWAAGLFVLGGIAVIGLPPTGSFISKLWILQGFAAAGVFWPIALILVASLLEAGYYFRWVRGLYASDPGSPVGGTAAGSVGEARGAAYAPLFLLAAVIVTLGLAPGLLEETVVGGAEAFLDRATYLESVLGDRP
jgi:proton-translocating NADH-quinone oxidoreductase chain N